MCLVWLKVLRIKEKYDRVKFFRISNNYSTCTWNYIFKNILITNDSIDWIILLK